MSSYGSSYTRDRLAELKSASATLNWDGKAAPSTLSAPSRGQGAIGLGRSGSLLGKKQHSAEVNLDGSDSPDNHLRSHSQPLNVISSEEPKKGLGGFIRRSTFSGSADGANFGRSHARKESKDLAWGLAFERCMVDVSAVRAKIGLIGKQNEKVKEVQAKILAAVSNTELQELCRELNSLMDAISKESREVANRLKELEKVALSENPKNQIPPDIEASTRRIRETQVANLRKKFMDLMSEYQELQVSFKAKCTDRVKKHFLIIKPTATEEELSEVAESNNLDLNKMLPGFHTENQKKLLQDVEEQHENILAIEKSILELHQLFVDMAVMVETQGEKVMQIEAHVNTTAEAVESGVEDLREMNRIRKRRRKIQCWIVVCAVIVLIIVTAVVVPVSLLRIVF